MVVGKKNEERVEARWQTFNNLGFRGLLEGPIRPGVRARKGEAPSKAERGGWSKESESAVRLEALSAPKDRLKRSGGTCKLGADIFPNGRPSGSGAGDSGLMSSKQAILPHSGGASGAGYKEIYNRQRAANAANQTHSGMQWQETAIELIRSLMDNMVTTRSIEVKRRCMQSIENEVSKLAYDSAILHRERIRYSRPCFLLVSHPIHSPLAASQFRRQRREYADTSYDDAVGSFPRSQVRRDGGVDVA